MGLCTVPACCLPSRVADPRPCHAWSQAARDPGALWKGADALVIDAGSNNDEEIYSKSASLHTWLLGYEFPETVVVMCYRAILVLTSKKKSALPSRRQSTAHCARREARCEHPASERIQRTRPAGVSREREPGGRLRWHASNQHAHIAHPMSWAFSLSPLSPAVQHLEHLKTAENATLPLELLTRDKADNTSNFDALVSAIKSSHGGATVGALMKEKPLGDFVSGWRGALEGSGLTQVEIAPALADLLAVKDSSETSSVKRASIFSAMLVLKQFVPAMEDVVDAEKKVTH